MSPPWVSVISATMNMGICVFAGVSVFNFLSIYLRVESLGHMASLCLTFWGAAKSFSTVAVPFYIPINHVRGLHFLHVFANTCFFLFVNDSHHSEVEWYAFSHTAHFLWSFPQIFDIVFRHNFICYMCQVNVMFMPVSGQCAEQSWSWKGQT